MSVSELLASPSGPLVDLLRCPKDQATPLHADQDDDALICPECATRYPVRDGIVSFLSAQALTEQDERERTMRDEESSWYDAMFVGYTNAVEVPTAVRRVDRPTGPVLDAGCGTGRITEALLALGQPVVAVDYSAACLRLTLQRTRAAARAGPPVLAVQSDLRNLPLRTGVMAAATCIEVYSQFREPDRRTVLGEVARALAPGAPFSISAFNYNLLFKAWKLRGNEGAQEGEHMLGGDYYYYRFRKSTLQRELEAVFDVEELVGVRNIPARTVAQLLRKARLGGADERFLRFMVGRGHRGDFWLERTPLADHIGFFWQAKVRARSQPTPRDTA